MRYLVNSACTQHSRQQYTASERARTVEDRPRAVKYGNKLQIARPLPALRVFVLRNRHHTLRAYATYFQAFQRVKPDERKVQLDDRFKAVLTDPRFQVSSGEQSYGEGVTTASTACFFVPRVSRFRLCWRSPPSLPWLFSLVGVTSSLAGQCNCKSTERRSSRCV